MTSSSSSSSSSSAERRRMMNSIPSFLVTQRLLLLLQLVLVALASAFVSSHHNGDNKLLNNRGPARQARQQRSRSWLTSLAEEGLITFLSKKKEEEEIFQLSKGLLQKIPILPARQSLESSFVENCTTSSSSNSNDACFSILTWNILLPNSNDNNWWNHKMYNPWVDMKHRQWEHRHALIKQRLLQSKADIICLQEVNGETFDQDFAFLMNDDNDAGYEGCLHKKYSFRCATFFKRDKFCLEQVAHKDRALVTSLKVKQQQQQQQQDTNVTTMNTGTHIDGNSNNNNSNKNDEDTFAYNRMIHIVNCHLSGGAAPEQRLRQIHDALDQIRKWNQKASQALQKQLLRAKKNRQPRPNPHSNKVARGHVVQQLQQEAAATTTLVVGDFNSDGNTAVRRLLVEGSVTPEWREPQYPNVLLTSKPKYNPLLPLPTIVDGNHHDNGVASSSSTTCTFVDAAELAYGANVCDGDYGEGDPISLETCRPPTYVVPNLASRLLSSPSETTMASAAAAAAAAAANNNDFMMVRTQFGRQVAQGLADTLGLQYFTRAEMEEAFETVDVNKDNYIDEDEVQVLLESVYVATFEKQIYEEKNRFFQGCFSNKQQQGDGGLTRDEFCQTIKALQQHQQQQQRSAAATNNDNDFGQRLSKGIMESLGLVQENNNDDECQELDLIQAAFDKVDLDGNSMIDESEIQSLLESAFTVMNGDRINAQKQMFFSGFFQQATSSSTSSSSRQHHGLTRDQFIVKLSALKQELQGGSQGAELVQVKTTTDAQHMIARFSPLLQSSLDLVFSKFSRDGKCLTQDEVNEFLIRVNGELGRGGTFRHAAAILERKRELQEPLILMRRGKWWQVVYDLEMCGAIIRPQQQQQQGEYGQEHNITNPHYQAWLDYIYFDMQSLTCRGLQEGLARSERLRIYKDGDALPNEWHPSDHLPVAAIFSWNNA